MIEPSAALDGSYLIGDHDRLVDLPVREDTRPVAQSAVESYLADQGLDPAEFRRWVNERSAS